MTFAKAFVSTFAALALATNVAAPALADFPGQHPNYVHALGDLREAYRLLNHGDYHPGVDAEEDGAIQSVLSAYQEIEQAGMRDGKDIGDHVADPMFGRPGRLRRALDALRDALHDVEGVETNPNAVSLRDRAKLNIEYAVGHVHKALHDASRAM